MVVALTLALGLFTGCAAADDSKGDKSAAAPKSSPTLPDIDEDDIPTTLATHTEPPPPEDHRLVKSDIKVTTKIRSKQCFGSAGCSVEVDVSLGFTIPDPGRLASDYDVTYRIIGDESGPVIETTTLYANGKYDRPYPVSLSTPSTTTPIRAEVVSVTKY